VREGVEVMRGDDWFELVVGDRALTMAAVEMFKESIAQKDEDPIQSLAYDPERYPHCIELEPK
jgi:hypothetical protein